jgi:chemotaxis protein CheX
MYVKFINPFISALRNVLQTMASMESHSEKPYLKEGPLVSDGVIGFIHMDGEQLDCTMAISFGEGPILAIASAMLGEDIKVLDDEIIDLVGEITNMVTGGVKKDLWQAGYSFDLSQPEFHSAKDFTPPHLEGAKVIVIPFQSASGPFYLEAAMQDSRIKANPDQYKSEPE